MKSYKTRTIATTDQPYLDHAYNDPSVAAYKQHGRLDRQDVVIYYLDPDLDQDDESNAHDWTTYIVYADGSYLGDETDFAIL